MSMSFVKYFNLNSINQCKQFNLTQHIFQFSRSNPMSSQPGYEPCLCYGDILLSFLWSSSIAEKSSVAIPNIKKQLFKSSQNTAPPDVNIPSAVVQNDTKKHDFIRTHFHRATQCDFCGKKV